MVRPNLIRQKLESGEPTLSTHIHSVWPAEIEAIGHAGIYDYVEFVAEYGPSDLHDLDNMCRTSELYNLGSMIKIDQSLMPFLAQRGIGSGYESVLFTDVRNIEEVRECIKICNNSSTFAEGHLIIYSTHRFRTEPQPANTVVLYESYLSGLRTITFGFCCEYAPGAQQIKQLAVRRSISIEIRT